MPAKESPGVWVRWGLPFLAAIITTATTVGIAYGVVSTRVSILEKNLQITADAAASRIAHSVASSTAQDVAYNEGLIINGRVDLIEQANLQRKEQLDRIEAHVASTQAEMVQIRLLIEKHIAADTLRGQP